MTRRVTEVSGFAPRPWEVWCKSKTPKGWEKPVKPEKPGNRSGRELTLEALAGFEALKARTSKPRARGRRRG